HIQQPAGIAAREAEQGLVFFQCYLLLAEPRIFAQSLLDDTHELCFREVLQYINLAAGEQRRKYLKWPIFGSSPDQCHQRALRGAAQRVLLRLGKTVDFIDTEDGLLLLEIFKLAGLVDYLPHILYAGIDRA